MKIAIIRLSALGDVIVSAAVLGALYERLRCEIHWYVDERFAEILQHSPCLQVHPIALKRLVKSLAIKELYALARTLHGQEYDCVIDMQGLFKSAIIGKLLQSKKFVGFDRNSIRESLASYFYDQKVQIPYDAPILQRNAKVICDALGLDLQSLLEQNFAKRRQIFGFGQSALAFIKAHLFPNRANILLLLEASIPSKTYSTQNFCLLVELLQKREFGILLLRHQDETKAYEIFARAQNYPFIKILPKMNLDCIKALVASVDLVIGGDTGITHLSWALENASITLYGNTPMQRFALGGVRNIALSGNVCANYDKKDFSINNIPPQEIFEQAERILCL
ncbi:lipopolysaccharide heptosyltransferase I [Helicobacter mustelae]|uniref:Lipopolysaccharide heptosyltransferase 1 n=1 Tax=Helicobacter mustelae (strain ATCC 43772 / CCUG 25715 / CIP 103759 / LMG 18044 / NCTC 12198 / R85-136P) TaxID=679897 RepID=D3UG95_HELM1|nr:lipopolysaccharide heptosyltransferase I [Helicobacter mustelae]CBG39516.1 putative lipopolysaccharide heptosyltransferase [Helicobacter mustelae 12198]SQH71027.1 lipopolysaccharide heptosyltransferase [Helicobacter mustelae]